MEKDLGSKQINNEQEVNEGFSGENIPEDYDPASKKLKKPGISGGSDNSDLRENAENRDRNYDIADDRYPSDHPENKKNRGNIES